MARRAMQMTVNGEKYVYDGKLMLPEAVSIQKATGWTKQEWMQQLDKGDVIAEAALLWVLRKRRYPDQPIPFEEMDYDTNGTDLTFLKRDGSPMDMEAIGARAQELMKEGASREEALTKAMDEADPEPGAEVVEPGNPTVADVGTVAVAEPVTTSPSSSPATPPSSPITSASVPGSSTS